jgi:membrane-associated phospholipid phosphatase
MATVDQTTFSNYCSEPLPLAALKHRDWMFQIGWPALLALLGIAAMTVDMPFAQWFHAKHFPRDLKKMCDLAEAFGHGFGAGVILLSVLVLAPQLRSRLPRVIFASYLAGAAGTLTKLAYARHRPNTMDGLETTVFNSFGSWFPFFSTGSEWQSFASGHSAMATGLAIGLTWLMPRGKWLFIALAALVMLQRIASGYHYLSDTLRGSAIGWFIAAGCLPGGWLSRPFDRLEERIQTTRNEHEIAAIRG